MPDLKFDQIYHAASDMPQHFTARNETEQLSSSPIETEDFPEEAETAEEEEKQQSRPRELLCESAGLVYD